MDRHIFGYLFANRAWALFLLHRDPEAEEALKNALEFTADGFKPGVAGVYYHAGRARLAGGQNARAAQNFQRAREVDPEGKYAALSDAALRGEFI